MDSFFYLVMFAGAVAGASTGLLGVYIVGMRMPFIGVCISHSAMAGTIYSILLGFLGIGLIQGSRSEVLGLLWGSLLFVRMSSVVTITILGLVFIVFAILFNKELKVLLFSRTIASATGVHESFVYCLFLALCGLIKYAQDTGRLSLRRRFLGR